MLQMIAELQRMRKDERGGITVLTLLLLIVMLVMGGMAVDFMRYETERVKLQSVTDRAVLASADLSAGDPSTTIKDFFSTAGYSNNMVGDPIVDENPGFRAVRVNSEVDINTFYLRLAGIDLLQAPATAEAREGIGKVEIAFVLDISQSMAGAKIDTLYEAAEEFAFRVLLNTEQRAEISAEQAYEAGLLDPTLTSAELADLEAAKNAAATAVPGSEPSQVALTVIPYAGAVNPGEWMFNYLKTERLDAQPNGVELLSSCPHMPRYHNESGTNAVDGDPVAAITADSFGGPTVDKTTFALSNTDDFLNKPLGLDWESIGFPREGLEQIPHFDYYGNNKTFTHNGKAQTIDFGWCPGPTSEIRWAMHDPYEATAFIQDMEMYDGTGTDYAIKWALAALDPNSRDAFEDMREADIISDHYTDLPAEWDDPRSRKIIVLMSDGGITGQRRPNGSYPHWGSDTDRMTNGESHWLTVKNRARANFITQCDLARERDVEVYTVAYQIADNANNHTLEYCASREVNAEGVVTSTKHFNAEGEELIQTFKDIAGSITDLRLSE